MIISLGRAGGPEITVVLVTAVARGISVLLRGCVDGTDHDKLLSSAEPGCEGSLGVAALLLGTCTNALHAVSAASLLITFVPETLSEFELTVDYVLTNWVGDGGCCACSQKGGGDHKTGTAGILIDGCSCSLPVGTLVSFGRAWIFFIVLGEGLPKPGIDFFEDFPLLTLVVANLELANLSKCPGRTQDLAPYYWLLGPSAVFHSHLLMDSY